ncbi:alanine/ornithine racemase family PLP-dependent enzyme [Rhodobacteraceae bacterium M385]|nr:alanine/ornithine racemase family PLP-dependent enzyme [Rhodobacteraceae bacterium M385]
MSCPRVEVDLSKIRGNTRTLVERLKGRGIGVTAVTKAVCGHPAIAQAMLDGGAVSLAEARLSNVRRLRQAGLTCPITLIRTPLLSQVYGVVQLCDASYNTEPSVITALAAAALRQGKVHDIFLMVEMGDQREGIKPSDVGDMARHVVGMPGVALKGIGANFACLSGISPTDAKMRALSSLANAVERQCGAVLRTVSGGNSANLPWALEVHATGRVNDLRIGEAVLLGVDPLTGRQIEGMHRDAFTLVAEVIEAGAGSARQFFQNTIGTPAINQLIRNALINNKIILGLGQQDIDAAGLLMPPGVTFIGATSDHLVIGTRGTPLRVGTEIRFQINYAALMRAMAAPDIQTKLRDDQPEPPIHKPQGSNRHLALT